MRNMQVLCGIRERPPHHRFEVNHYACFQVNHVIGGHVRLYVRDSDILLEPGETYVLPWGCSPRLVHGDEPFAAVYASLYGERRQYPEHFRGEVAVLPISREIDALAQVIRHEVDRPGRDSRLLLEHLGWSLACVGNRLRLSHQQDARHLREPEYWAERVRHIIEGTVHTRRPLNEALAELPLSYRQLARHFEAVAGCGPKDYQLACILRHARHLLRHTDLPVTVIALDLGFSSSQSFSTLFQRRVGVSPTAYRRAPSEANATEE